MTAKSKLISRGMMTVLLTGLVLNLAAYGGQAKTLGAIDVTEAPYNANASGSADDTPAFQKALDAAATNGDVVKVPAGRYKFSGSLRIPAQVVLEGVNDGERSYAGYMNGTKSGDVMASAGTVFLVTGGAGSTVGAKFVTLNSNSVLRNVTLYYPNQPLSTAPGWRAPKAYPPAVSLAGHSGTMENVCGVNPYTFITDSGTGNVIRRVVGQPLFLGIRLDNDADPPEQSGERLEDVHFLTTWDSHPAMMGWMQAHATAFSTFHANEFGMRNCVCTGYSVGFCFSRSAGGAAYGTLSGCSAFHCGLAVQIGACEPGSGGGLVFDGGGFGESLKQAVDILSANTGSVTFNSCRFYGSPISLVTNASAAGSVVSLLACDFESWGTSVSGLNASVPCVSCGDTAYPTKISGKTRMLNCNFGADQYQYAYTPGEASVLFENNSTVNGIHVRVSGTALPSASDPNYAQINNF